MVAWKSDGTHLQEFHALRVELANAETNYVLITQGPYKFRNENADEDTVWLGVPDYDVVFYVNPYNRSATTGTRARELSERLGASAI